MIEELIATDSLSVTKRLAFPVLRGPLAGMWWNPTSGLLSPYVGSYRQTQCSIFEKTIGAGRTVIDVGAGCGFFTLLFARLVGTSGCVVSAEQSRERFEVLKHHVRQNGLRQVKVTRATISGCSDVRHKYADITLDNLTANFGLAPTHIRLSVETNTLATLHGGSETIAKYQPVLFVTTRGNLIHHQCCKWLAELGYAIRPLVGSNVSNAEELICTPQQNPNVRAA